MRRVVAGVVVALASVVAGPGSVDSVADTGLDTTFGDGGVAYTAVGDAYGYEGTMALQSDGRVVVLGFSDWAGKDEFTLVRHTSDGQLDPSFGIGGVATTSVASTAGYPTDLAVDGQNGSIVAVGGTFNGTHSDIVVARFDSSGAVDSSFGTGGVVTTSVGPSHDYAHAVGLQADGKIVVAGQSVDGFPSYFALLRYLPTGALDPSFGVGGKVTVTSGATNTSAFSVAVMNDGSIVAAGHSGKDQSLWGIAVVRVLANGTPDPNFGVGGMVTTSASSGNDQAYGVVVQPDGRIVVAGRAGPDVALVRYMPDGSLDPSFGDGGIVTTSLDGGTDVARGLVLLPDGRLLVAGRTPGGIGVARYLSDGSLDPSFGLNGTLVTPVGTYVAANSVAVQADGTIVVGGDATLGARDGFFAARFHVDGRTPVPVVLPVELPALVNAPVVTTTVAPVTTLPPVTTVPADTSGIPRALAPGEIEVTEDGRPTAVAMEVRDDTTLTLTGDGYLVSITGRCAGACGLGDGSAERPIVELSQGGVMRLTGEGFEPGATVMAWLYSEPTYLGEVAVGPDGAFEADFAVGQVVVGAHTLRLAGTGAGGTNRVIDLGVVVSPSGTPSPEPGALPSTGTHSSTALLWWSLVLLVSGGVVLRRIRVSSHLR